MSIAPPNSSDLKFQLFAGGAGPVVDRPISSSAPLSAMTRERWPTLSKLADAVARVTSVIRDAALAYARCLGWSVLPVRGKVPAIPKEERGGRGYLDATTNPDTILAYWGRCPHANVAVSCIGSGFIALD